MNLLVLVILLLALIGCGVVVAGIFLLCGLGWSLVAAGLFLLGFAALLRLGLTNG